MDTNDLRKASMAVFLATEADVAKDISDKLMWAADTIDALHKQIASQQADAMAEEKPCIECGEIGRHLFGCRMPKLDSADGATECHCESPAWPLGPCVNCGGMPPLI